MYIADDAMQMDVQKSLYPFYTTKKMPRVTVKITKNVSLAAIARYSGVRRKFSWGGLGKDHMVVICIWFALLVTSQLDVISMFPNQRFGEVC